MNVSGDQTHEINNCKCKQNENEKKYWLIFSNFFYLIFQHIPPHIFRDSNFASPLHKTSNIGAIEHNKLIKFLNTRELNKNIYTKIGKNHTFEYTNFYSFVLFLLQMPKPWKMMVITKKVSELKISKKKILPKFFFTY